MRIPKYKLYHTNHPDGTAHGGTAILIKESIVHNEVLKFEEDYLQATSINVQTFPYDVTISAVYCPPRHNLKKCDFETFFKTLGSRFIAAGDFNSKNVLWGSRLTTTKGRELFKVIQDNNYSFLSTGSPTYWPTDTNKIPDLLDLFIVNGISTIYTDIVSSYDLTSDHSPIIATISTTIITKKAAPRLHNSKTNWDTYRQIIEDNVQLSVSLQTQEDIERETDNLIELIQRAAYLATPHITNQKSTTDNTYIPCVIKRMVAEKRRARSDWQRTHTPESKRKYNQLSSKLKTKLDEVRNASFEQYILSLTRQDNSIWKPVKRKNKPTSSCPPIRKSLEQSTPWAKTDKEKADLFAMHLSEVFSPMDDILDPEVDQFLATDILVQEQLKLVTPKEVCQEIKALKLKKAPGTDLITAKALKELPKKGLMKLVYVINSILRIGCWPKALKVAQIIMISKPGKDPTLASSYRPISLLPIISKMIEKLLLKRLHTDMDQQNWIPAHQFGFRQSHSTIQQCHRIADRIHHTLENKEYCPAVFLDISQAFDKVWHQGLLYKIKQILPPQYFKLLSSYLSKREFNVKVNTETSVRCCIRSGVPQGSVLGPILYLLYTSDIPTASTTTLSTFADDTAVIATHEDPEIAVSRLQAHLNSIETWLSRWKIKVNESKSTYVVFTLRRQLCPQVTFNQTIIPQQEVVKYLGMHFDSKLNWKKHIVAKRKHIDLRAKEMGWLIGQKSRLSLSNKVLIYKTIIKPIWTYGIELWGCASKSNIAIMQRCQSKILRQITNAPWYVSNHTLHTDLRMPYITDEIHDRAQNHHARLVNHPNPTIEPLITPIDIRRLKRILPLDL